MIFDTINAMASVPATGDRFPVTILVIIAIVAAGAAGVSVMLGKKKDDNDKK